MSTNTDRIEKTIFLRAPRSKVWSAISDSKQFGAWFGVEWFEPFAPGATVHGRITNPPEYAHLRFDIIVDEVVPEQRLAYRWHPAAIDSKIDYSKEPRTLVVFELEDAPGGTRLKLTESGFDKLSPERRANAFRMNDGGWGVQMERIEKYVVQAA
jgi:uncharacterized protein YndB with AHSA1/START domain